MDVPVVIKSDKIVLTDAEGFFCFKMANAPDTAGVANDVPLPVPVPPPGIDDTTDSPGAIRLRREDLSENDDTASESFVEPTLTALEMHAGDSSALIYPSFPAATTGAMPTDCNVSNSVLYEGNDESQYPVNA